MTLPSSTSLFPADSSSQQKAICLHIFPSLCCLLPFPYSSKIFCLNVRVSMEIYSSRVQSACASHLSFATVLLCLLLSWMRILVLSDNVVSLPTLQQQQPECTTLSPDGGVSRIFVQPDCLLSVSCAYFMRSSLVSIDFPALMEEKEEA